MREAWPPATRENPDQRINGAQSACAPECFTPTAQRLISSSRNRAKSRAPAKLTVMPGFSNAAISSRSERILRSSASSRAMTAAGVPPVVMTPVQPLTPSGEIGDSARRKSDDEPDRLRRVLSEGGGGEE